MLNKCMIYKWTVIKWAPEIINGYQKCFFFEAQKNNCATFRKRIHPRGSLIQRGIPWTLRVP